MEAIGLPKNELMTFNRDPLKYLLFIRGFEKTVDKLSINYNPKLTRLVQYGGDKAKKGDAVLCCNGSIGWISQSEEHA